MRYFFLFLVSFSILVSCQNKNEKPNGLIEEDKMILVIKDLMLLEATYNTQLIRVQDKSERMNRYSQEIFNKFEITQEQFDLSYEYYSKDLQDFELMMEQVFEELNKMETEAVNSKKTKSKKDTTKVSR